jgi:hypothetical protein
MQNSVFYDESAVLAWFDNLPIAPAPVFERDPYSGYERMSDAEMAQLVNRRFVLPRRKFDANSNDIPLARRVVEYHRGGHKHDPAIKTSYANIDKAHAIEAKKGKK